MGILGFLFLMGGIGMCLLGVIGIVVGIISWDLPNAGYSLALLIGGLLSGAIGTAILE